MAHYKFSAMLVLYRTEKANWYFITLPEDMSAELKFSNPHCRRAWGAIPTHATIGDTHWKTSVFWDSKQNAYILPVKAEIRKREGIKEGSEVIVELEAGV